MCFGAILDHLEATFYPFGAILKNFKIFDFDVILGVFWPVLGSFWGHLGPRFNPKSPQSEGGTGQNGTKTGPERPKMGFGAILDHLEATFIHFGPFGFIFFFRF